MLPNFTVYNIPILIMLITQAVNFIQNSMAARLQPNEYE